MSEKTIYKVHNPIARKYEVIDLDEAELAPGETVVKMYRDNFTGRYVTIPGASLFKVTTDLQLELIND